MRKLIYQLAVSLDGFYEREDGDISWHVVDEDLHQYATEMFDNADTEIFGRINYQLFESFWPKVLEDPSASPSNRNLAERLNNFKKIVFSRTLKEVSWNNSILLRGNVAEEVQKLKQMPGKDILIGGSNLASTLASAGLIDEYRIIVSPVVLGSGHAALAGIDKRLPLKLKGSRVFRSGNVLLYYTP